MLARASVHGHGLDHPQREDAEPPLMGARRRRGQLAAERLQRLHESRGDPRRDHAEGDVGGVLDLRDHQVLQRVREEHPGVVALELVRRPLEVHQRVLGELPDHAREQVRRGRRPGTATPDDHDVDAQRLAGELELREELVPALREHARKQDDDERMPRRVDPDALGSPPWLCLLLRRLPGDPCHRRQRYHGGLPAGDFVVSRSATYAGLAVSGRIAVSRGVTYAASR
jgi:hypothetical protein